MNQLFNKRVSTLFISYLALLNCLLLAETVRARTSQFDNYDIRVIRPKFFQKTNRVELGVGTQFLVNQTFIYSVFAEGHVNYHVNEVFGVGLQAGISGAFDKSEASLLKDEFLLNPIILTPKSYAVGKLLWSPLYGKFQLKSRQILYFNTEVSVGAGTTDIRFSYDHCSTELGIEPVPSSSQFPTLVAGIEQRLYFDQKFSINIGVNYQRVQYSSDLTSCAENQNQQYQSVYEAVLVGFGFSYFL